MLAKSASKTLKYYDYYICPFCKPVEFLLKATKIPHERHHLDLRKAEHKTEEYKKINPFQKVPAIIDDDFILFESNTIMRYLCNSKEVDDHWYPKDPKARAIVDLYFDWHTANILNLRKWDFVNSGLTQYTGGITLADAKVITDKAYKELEDVFLSRRIFLASNDKITIADLALLWHLTSSSKNGYEFSEKVKIYYMAVINSEAGLKDMVDEYLNNVAEFRKNKQ